MGGYGLAPRLAARSPHHDSPLLFTAGLPGVEVGVDPRAVLEVELNLGSILGCEHLVGGHAKKDGVAARS